MEKNKIIIMSIMSYYARQIFDETKPFEFRKSALKSFDLNQKIYVYSAKEDKAIIGYMKVSEILHGTTKEIMRLTGYDKRKDGQEIIDYYGINNNNCFALNLYDVTEFSKHLELKDLRKIDLNIDLPQYYKYFYEGSPIYKLITEWDKSFSLDGNEKDNSSNVLEMLKRGGK